MVAKTEAIRLFLAANAPRDLAQRYTPEMECQVNVAKDNGKRIEGQYLGKTWTGFSDGVTTWKSWRIPFKASTEPEYVDSELTFASDHFEAIGMTGWNYAKRRSEWVAFDFDAIIGHADKHTKKLSDTEMTTVIEMASSLPWVTVRRSTSGTGIHLYVFLDNVPTANHTEHAALGRAVLGMMSALTGFDFRNKVDICGGNMWVWHRKMRGTNGLTLIKEGQILLDPPTNWRDHINVVSGKALKTRPTLEKDQSKMDELIQNTATLSVLDKDHIALMKWLEDSGATWWWDQDNSMLVTHTAHLKEAHSALALRGVFDTSTRHSSAQNCFAFPLKNGAWTVRRYSLGVQEMASWEQDASGWTRCLFNVPVTLRVACRMNMGKENAKGHYLFQYAEDAVEALTLVGGVITLPVQYRKRPATIKVIKNRVVVEVDRNGNDDATDMVQWIAEKDVWTRVILNQEPQTVVDSENNDYSDQIRHVVTPSGEDSGWRLMTEDTWHQEPLSHIRPALLASGVPMNKHQTIIGTAVKNCWTLVNRPFQPEYPGGRLWNINAAQLRYQPLIDTEALLHPHWDSILRHCGSSLDDAVQTHPWCRANEISSGMDYLKVWAANIFQHPTEPTPYLFMYGPQNSGKSILHEALALLLTKGYTRADMALISSSGFNAELEGAVICVVEETDLSKSKQAYNRIKDWVTGREIQIHPKGQTPYHVPNTTHWVQCANSLNSLPVFSGDTRITVLNVQPLPLAELIPKKRLLAYLDKEAAAFITSLLAVELPESNDRLAVPVIETEHKQALEEYNQTEHERFASENIRPCAGKLIKFADYMGIFHSVLTPEAQASYTKHAVSKSLASLGYITGKYNVDHDTYITNVEWKKPEVKHLEKVFSTLRIVVRDGYIRG